MAGYRPAIVPRATYRLQLQPAFDFDAATRIADYLHDLGISHVYSSPYLQAAPGSLHGYDVVDPRRVSSDLGGPVAHQRFGQRLGERDLGQVLDVVPNHMAIGGAENPWWWDVLENGPASRYARFFDVEWDSADPQFRATVLLPVLADHYGRELEAGALSVERERGSFVVRYADRTFPVAPRSLEPLLVEAGRETASDELIYIGESFGELPSPTVTDRESINRRHRGKEVLKLQLGRLLTDRAELAEAVDLATERLNSDIERLDQLIAAQNYRLAYWRAAGEDLDYRRFFDVTTLAGLRMEDEHVFAETHELVLGWLRDGTLDGLRIDHPDGLRDPKAYFDRLHAAAPRAWIVAEKVLETGEQLPEDWPIAGTTGYDFLNLVNRLYTDPDGERPLTELYHAVTGVEEGFDAIAYAARQEVLGSVLAAELNRLTEYLLSVVRGHRRHRDYTRSQVRGALRELLAVFPVYRTYVQPETGQASRADVQHVRLAIDTALERRADLPADLMDFLAEVLLLRVGGEAESEFVLRFQQVTGPVMAKGVEDTAFYRYNRLVSANEVGGDPALFSASVDDFHAAASKTQHAWPTTQLASSTHDTKRSEDVRARIGLLSELPDEWRTEVLAWRAAATFRPESVDPNTEYLLYQTLVGAWPIAAARLWAYLEKAVREQKTHTSWTEPNADYEAGLRSFVERLLADPDLSARIAAFVDRLAPAWQVSALARTLLKLTAPGVPDVYQGAEIWDLSLVDPDNRRPVDYAKRRRLLQRARTADAAGAMAGLDSGLAKIWLISRVLGVRRRRPELFGPDAVYQPLPVSGARDEHVVAFARGGEAVVVVPRFLWRLGLHDGGQVDWADTNLELPAGAWHDELSDRPRRGGHVSLGELLADFPMALLLPEAI